MASPVGTTSKLQRPRFFRTHRRFGWEWLRQLPMPWLAMAIVCLAMLGYVAESGKFDIRAITVDGLNLSPKLISQIDAQCDCIGMNVFVVKPDDIQQRLEGIPQLVVTRVYTSLPNQLVVEASLKKPVAIWRTPDAAYSVAADGEVLQVWEAPFPKHGWPGLPVFDEHYDSVFQQGQPWHAGQHVAVDALAMALSVHSKVARLSLNVPEPAGVMPPPLAKRIGSYLYQPLAGLILVGHSNWWAVLGMDRSSNLDYRLDVLVAVLSRQAAALTAGKCIDLRNVDAQTSGVTISRDHNCV